MTVVVVAVAVALALWWARDLKEFLALLAVEAVLLWGLHHVQ